MERYDGYGRINKQKWKLFEAGKITKAELQYQRFAEFFEAYAITGMDPVKVNFQYLDNLADGSQLLDGAYELCRDISPGRRMAIITNGVERTQIGRFEKSTIRPFFEAIFVSERIGVAKPEEKYFNHVFSGMGLTDKRSVLIVGDSLSSDIEGGIRYGVDTCFFNAGKIRTDGGSRATYEVTQLADIRMLV